LLTVLHVSSAFSIPGLVPREYNYHQTLNIEMSKHATTRS